MKSKEELEVKIKEFRQRLKIRLEVGATKDILHIFDKIFSSEDKR